MNYLLMDKLEGVTPTRERLADMGYEERERLREAFKKSYMYVCEGPKCILDCVG